jgi:hypothetical protein
MLHRHFITSARRPLLRQCIHTTSPRYDSIDWKSPLRTLGIRKPLSLAAGALTLTFFLTFPFWFKQPLPANYHRNDDLPAPVRGSPPATPILKSVIDEPASKELKVDNFPEKIRVPGRSTSDQFRLVAWGVRTVSFLGIKVYNVALYIPESQVPVLPSYAQSNIDGDPWAPLIRIYECPMLLRIIPVRNTDYAHLRDGFVRSTLSRMKMEGEDEERVKTRDDAVTLFKGLFPRQKMKKGEVLSIIKLGPELRMYAGGNMEEDLGSVRNDDLARGLLSAYLVGDNVVSPDLKKNLTKRLKEIADAPLKEITG